MKIFSRNTVSLLLVLSMSIMLSACGNTATQSTTDKNISAVPSGKDSTTTTSDEVQSPSDENQNDDNILIAYFSRAGENYGVGTIEKGNTQIITEMIAN